MSAAQNDHRTRWSAFGHVVAATLLCLGLGIAAGAQAQTVFRTDEVPPGEVDPARASKSGDAMLMYNLYETLLLPGPGGKGIVPNLAESYSVDDKVFTFKLRPHVKFHSGNELSAADVVYSLNRLISVGAGYSSLFRGWIASAEAPDPLTVKITLTNTYAPFLSALFRLAIVDSKTVQAHLQDGPGGEARDYGVAYLHDHDAGSGAYRLVSHNPQTEAVLEKYPEYFRGVPAAAPDQVRVAFGVPGPTEIALMRRGELDLISQWSSPETKRSAAQIKGVKIVGESGIAEFIIKLNTKRAPLDDLHCRRALALSLDYDALLGLANITPQIKGAKPARGPIIEGMLGYDPSVATPARDLDKAKAELAQCHYKPGEQDFEISWIGEVALEERFALLMQSNWAELGFKTHITRYPFATYTQTIGKPETTPHVSQLYYNARTPDPDPLLYNAYSSKAVGSYISVEWLQNPEVDALLDKGRSTLDPAEREKIYRKIAETINDLQPDMFGFEIINTYPKAERVTIPMLEDPARNTHIYGLNFTFRDMEMK